VYVHAALLVIKIMFSDIMASFFLEMISSIARRRDKEVGGVSRVFIPRRTVRQPLSLESETATSACLVLPTTLCGTCLQVLRRSGAFEELHLLEH
jgi:hypothetical protein